MVPVRETTIGRPETDIDLLVSLATSARERWGAIPPVGSDEDTIRAAYDAFTEIILDLDDWGGGERVFAGVTYVDHPPGRWDAIMSLIWVVRDQWDEVKDFWNPIDDTVDTHIECAIDGLVWITEVSRRGR